MIDLLQLIAIGFFGVAMAGFPWVLCCCDPCGPCCGGAADVGGCVPNILYCSFEEAPDSDQPCICPNGIQNYEAVWDTVDFPNKWAFDASSSLSDPCALMEVQLTIALWCELDEETGEPTWHCELSHNFTAAWIAGTQVGDVNCDPFQIVFDFELVDSPFCPTSAPGQPAKIRMTITA